MQSFYMDDNHIKITASVVVPFPSIFSKKFIYVLNKKDGKWGLPAGKIKPFERIDLGGERETLEEANIHIVLKKLLGISYFKSERGSSVISFNYWGEYIEGIPGHNGKENIQEVKALSLDEIVDFASKKIIRAGQVNIDPIRDYLSGNFMPKNSIRNYN